MPTRIDGDHHADIGEDVAVSVGPANNDTAVERPVTVADCERVQTNWFSVRAVRLGGQVWIDGPLTWIDGRTGAHDAVLNATDEGALLYRAAGFRTIGEGITWWLRL